MLPLTFALFMLSNGNLNDLVPIPVVQEITFIIFLLLSYFTFLKKKILFSLCKSFNSVGLNLLISKME